MQKYFFDFIQKKDQRQFSFQTVFLGLILILFLLFDKDAINLTQINDQLQANETAQKSEERSQPSQTLREEYSLIFDKIAEMETKYVKEISFFKMKSYLDESQPTFYLATNGNDAWSGKLAEPNANKTDGPFATFARTQQAVRELQAQQAITQSIVPTTQTQLKNEKTEKSEEKAGFNALSILNSSQKGQHPIIILVRGGIYEFSAPFELTEKDSGTVDSPIIWKAADGEEVRLVGGKYLSHFFSLAEENPQVISEKNRNIETVNDNNNNNDLKNGIDFFEAREMLKPEVRNKIICCDLQSNGINDYGTPNENGAEIFFEEKPLHLSRYPNQGFLKIKSLTTEGTTPVDIRGTKGIAQGIFQFDDEHLLTWEKEKDIWVHGYWFWDWSEQRHKVESIDPISKTLKVLPPYHSYGYRVGQWFYAFNLLSEIDEPGEFYIDREKGLLYFYPPQTEKVKTSEVVISIIPNILKMQNVSNLVWDGFIFEAARQDAIVINGGSNNLISRCSIRNIGGTGISTNGFNHEIFDCHLYQCGRGGISMSGGNRTALTPGKNRAIGNRIHDYGRIQRVYAAGVQINGVGNYIGYNQISDAPHMGIGFGGNDHLIEYNEISNVCFESNDAGAVYTGRNWTMRGTILCFNYLHDITGFENRGCVGIYLDDMFSSADIVGNLFKNVTRAAFIGGGRDCGIFNNIFVDCKPSLHIDARALGWAHDHADGWLQEAQEQKTISSIKWNEPPYSDHYPKLASILDEGKTPKAPEGNYIANNICVGGTWDINKYGQWQGNSVEEAARPYLTFENNLVLTEDSVLIPSQSTNDDSKMNDSDQQPNEQQTFSATQIFVDPENNNFRLQPELPCLPIGFQSFPLEKIGQCPTFETEGK